VRACLDVGLRPLPGMPAEALLRSDAPLDLLPIAPSRAVDPARLQKASSILHRLVTTCGEPRSPGGLVLPGSREGAASAGPQGDAGSSTEGTSGRADLGLLRGRTGDAALGPGCVRASDTLRGGSPCLSQDSPRSVVAGGLAQAGRRGSASSCPSRGWSSCGGIVTGAAPQKVRRLAAPEPPSGGVTISRREVSERSGLG